MRNTRAKGTSSWHSQAHGMTALARRQRGADEGARLQRVEDSLGTLHAKLDRLVEEAAVARTDIAWLKWGTRLLFMAVLGVGGLTAGQFVT
jgi:hypothetical protein